MKVYMVTAHDNNNGGEEETYLVKLENEQDEKMYDDFADTCFTSGKMKDELNKYGLEEDDIHFYAMSGDYFHNGVMKMGDFDYTLKGEMKK